MPIEIIKKECPVCHHDHMIKDDSNNTFTCPNCGIQLKCISDLKSMLISYLNEKMKSIILDKVKAHFSGEMFMTQGLILSMIHSAYMMYLCTGDISFVNEDFFRTIGGTISDGAKKEVINTIMGGTASKRIQEIGYDKIIHFFISEVVYDLELNASMNTPEVKYAIDRYVELSNQ